MVKASALLVAGAVIMTAGAAHAQDSTLTDANAARGAMPWYERFTTSTGLTENITGATENDRIAPPAWTLNQHWGVTVDVRQAQRVERGQDRVQPDQTAVGAYYQFTPRVRLGGEVSVENRQTPGAAQIGRAAEQAEPAAGVKLESAFRF